MNQCTLKCQGAAIAQLIVLAVLVCSAVSGWSQSRFSVSADGTEVTDTRTGVVWRRCSAGQAYSGGTCIGTASSYTHEQALAYAETQVGWRLPNVKELSSIVDTDRTPLSVDPVAFPGTPANWYWTSSPLAVNPDYAWYVRFSFGQISFDRRYNSNYVRLVR